MPIKGLTDRGLSFPEIGQIRKGAPKDDKGQVGKDLTYFRVVFDEREVEAQNTFSRVYGEKPTEIRVILPFDDIERCWDAWLEAYTAGRMVARSDGEYFTYLVDTKTGDHTVINGEPKTPHREVVGTYTNSRTNKQETIKCRPVGRLRVIIPELGRAAYLTVLTTSTHDIGNISAQLEALKSVNNGRIAGIPLILRRRPKKISVPKSDGSKMRLTKWMLSIEADPEWVKRLLVQVKTLALPGNGLALLPEGEPEDYIEVEAEDVEEFDDDIPTSEGDPEEPPTQPEYTNPEDILQPEDPPYIPIADHKAITPAMDARYVQLATKALELGLISELPEIPQEYDTLVKSGKDLAGMIAEEEARIIGS